ncbi:MAG TPA: hypothetical protein VGD95_06445 [Micavibrio sp.]
MMTKSFKFLMIAATCLCLSAPAAHAGVDGSGSGPKPTIWAWWPWHWTNLDFKPYIDHPTQAHNSQWDQSNWKPADWAAQRGGKNMNVISGFYQADIIRSQMVDDDIPVLVVGPAFYMLGGHDKRRVMEVIDDEFQITAGKLNGMFMIRDWNTKRDIGSYTVHGLQLQ